MFAEMGHSGIRRLLGQWLASSGIECTETDDAGLKFIYNRLLATRQPHATLSTTGHAQFIMEPALERVLLECFREPPGYDQQLDPVDDQAIERALRARDADWVTSCGRRIAAAHQQLWDIAPDWGATFDLAINRVFSSRMAGTLAGSSPEAIGVIWMAPPADADTVDLSEALVHELAHHLSFIARQAAGPATQPHARGVRVHSVIRGVPRPLGAVYDSLLVAADVLLLRERAGWHAHVPRLHPPSKRLLHASQLSCAQLLNAHREDFTPHGLERLQAVSHTLAAF